MLKVVHDADASNENATAGGSLLDEIVCDGAQEDPGVFEQLLQPLYLTGAFPGDRSARPSQITKLPDRLGWHERGPHKTVCAELGQPGRVGDIGLAAREVFTCRALPSSTSNPASSNR
jgi:hypothetical protein